jgi:peptidylprolyl isomerase domain and WD repeat-containing protein 1
MHKEILQNILVSAKTDTLITISIDGHIKFWKKVYHLIEFIKHFKAHSGLITGASFS